MYCNWPYSPDWTHISDDRHIIVHMTELYTRLVTYARLHILTLVVFFYHDISYISFITLFLILIILFQFIMLLLTLFLCTSTFPLHTLIRSLLTTLNLHVQILDILCSCSGVHWARTLCEELEFLSFGSDILFSLVFLLFPDSWYISDSVFIPVLFIWYHAWMLICNIAVIVDSL